MSERIRGSYNDALYKSTFTLLYFTLQGTVVQRVNGRVISGGKTGPKRSVGELEDVL